MTWIHRGSLAVACVAVAIFGYVAWLSSAPRPTAFIGGPTVSLSAYKGVNPAGVPAELAGADAVAKGKYITRAADCVACHTAPGGVPFAGGRAFKLPFGILYSPNITPDPDTGIGKWSGEQFLRAVHEGIGRAGERLYPAFPYASYTLMSDDDVLSIRTYLFSLQPVRQIAPANTLAFPFNQRWLMAIWATLFNGDKRFRPSPAQSDTWNRGAYLVEAAGHCAECHSPRNVLQAIDNRKKFAGGNAGGWNAYNITSDRLTGIGNWTAQDLQRYLSTGHSAGRGSATGPMAEVVEASLSKLTQADIAAIVVYLRSVPPIHSPQLAAGLAGPAPIDPKSFTGNLAGRRIFEGACASCHAWSGAGALKAEAQLTGSRAVNDPSAANVAQVVLSGAGHATGGRPYMPSFAAAYTDQEIAEVANYVTARFGAKPSRIDAKTVARLRTLD